MVTLGPAQTQVCLQLQQFRARAGYIIVLTDTIYYSSHTLFFGSKELNEFRLPPLFILCHGLL